MLGLMSLLCQHTHCVLLPPGGGKSRQKLILAYQEEKWWNASAYSELQRLLILLGPLKYFTVFPRPQPSAFLPCLLPLPLALLPLAASLPPLHALSHLASKCSSCMPMPGREIARCFLFCHANAARTPRPALSPSLQRARFQRQKCAVFKVFDCCHAKSTAYLLDDSARRHAVFTRAPRRHAKRARVPSQKFCARV